MKTLITEDTLTFGQEPEGKLFLIFPIAALNSDEDEKQRVINAWAWANHNYGKEKINAIRREYDADNGLIEAAELVQRWVDEHQIEGFDPQQEDHAAYIIGSAVLIGAPDGLSCPLAMELIGKVDLAVQRFGDTRACVRHDIITDTLSGRMPYREFSVLVAILSKLGKKKFCKATLLEVRRRSAGVVNEDDISDAVAVLTHKPVRDTLDNLYGLCWFARFIYNRGETFYSFRLQPAQLEGEVLNSKTFKERRNRENREWSREASARIKAKLVEIRTGGASSRSSGKKLTYRRPGQHQGNVNKNTYNKKTLNEKTGNENTNNQKTKK